MKKDELTKSIVWNKHLNKILKYCYEDIKNKVIIEKMIEQDKIRRKGAQKQKVIKYNFS